MDAVEKMLDLALFLVWGREQDPRAGGLRVLLMDPVTSEGVGSILWCSQWTHAKEAVHIKEETSAGC